MQQRAMRHNVARRSIVLSGAMRCSAAAVGGPGNDSAGIDNERDTQSDNTGSDIKGTIA